MKTRIERLLDQPIIGSLSLLATLFGGMAGYALQTNLLITVPGVGWVLSGAAAFGAAGLLCVGSAWLFWSTPD